MAMQAQRSQSKRSVKNLDVIFRVWTALALLSYGFSFLRGALVSPSYPRHFLLTIIGLVIYWGLYNKKKWSYYPGIVWFAHGIIGVLMGMWELWISDIPVYVEPNSSYKATMPAAMAVMLLIHSTILTILIRIRKTYFQK
jgi:hypothetical protein